jgi:hypothetical protein
MVALGRLVEHDERSRLYQAAQAGTQRSVLWAHHAPVLDQGQLGSCTGNALAQCLNTDYFTTSRKGRYLTETDAVELYSSATKLDGIPGNTYPPTDGGSSGLGVCKAGKKLGYLTGYKHTFSFTSFTAALQLQPVIVGTSWYEGMFKTDRDGFVKPVGALAGGHEYAVIGVQYETQVLTFLQSWGSSWGLSGRFHMTFAAFQTLLADQGDATAPVGA